MLPPADREKCPESFQSLYDISRLCRRLNRKHEESNQPCSRFPTAGCVLTVIDCFKQKPVNRKGPISMTRNKLGSPRQKRSGIAWGVTGEHYGWIVVEVLWSRAESFGDATTMCGWCFIWPALPVENGSRRELQQRRDKARVFKTWSALVEQDARYNLVLFRGTAHCKGAFI
jgi:hypothetical protein